MKRIALALTLMAALPAWGQDTNGIETTISGQMDAFGARDVSRAFSFASPMIQRLFENPTNFGMMVAHGYPMVWDHGDLRYLGLRQDGERWVQRVMVSDSGGALHTLDYYMVEGPSGWLVDGVELVSADAPTT